MLGELEVLLGPGEVSPSKGIDLFLCRPESGLGSPDSPQASTSDIRTLPAPPLLRSGQQVFLRANWPWLQVSFKVRKTVEVSDKGRSQMGFNEVTLS